MSTDERQNQKEIRMWTRGWARFLLSAGLLAMLGIVGSTGMAADEFSLEVRTWSCPASPDRDEIYVKGMRPDTCAPLDLTGTLRAKSWTMGTPSDGIAWEEVAIDGASTTMTNIPVNGSGAMVQLPAADDTGSIMFLYGDRVLDPNAVDDSDQPHGWIRYDTGEDRAEATFDVHSNTVIDVLYLESPYEMVPNSSITLHRWSCPGSIDNFNPDECSPGIDADPYLWAGPNVEGNEPGRFPDYDSDGPTGIYRDLDPLTYRFATADAGLAGATISARVLVIPKDEAQTIDNNVFGPEEPGDKYFAFSVAISPEQPVWEFNVYEFPDVPSS